MYWNKINLFSTLSGQYATVMLSAYILLSILDSSMVARLHVGERNHLERHRHLVTSTQPR